jgi:LacI family transcriptional regulator
MEQAAPPHRTGRSVTQEEVGRVAGVSGKTVARVMARDPHVSEATRQKVERAIRETGFRPNVAARSLAAARSYLVAIFVPDHSSLYHADLFRSAAAACSVNGYHLLLEEYDAATDGSAIARYRESQRRVQCDAVLLPPPLSNDRELIECLKRDGMAHVLISPAGQADNVPAVFADERAGMIALFDHLWTRGHRRFGLCTAPPGHPYLHQRNDIFLQCLEGKGVSEADATFAPFAWHGSGMLSGRAAAAFLLTREPRPDAIFSFNDEYAQGVIIGAQELGIRVPDSLAVAGFDDGAAAQFAWPPLTTIRQPLDRMAAKAVELAIHGGEPCTYPVELIIRQSTVPEDSRG